MTQKKHKPTPRKHRLDKEAKEAVAAAVAAAQRPPFGKRCWAIFLRLVFMTSLSFFSVIFCALALVLMPIALPIAFASSYLKKPKLPS